MACRPPPLRGAYKVGLLATGRPPCRPPSAAALKPRFTSVFSFSVTGSKLQSQKRDPRPPPLGPSAEPAVACSRVGLIERRCCSSDCTHEALEENTDEILMLLRRISVEWLYPARARRLRRHPRSARETSTKFVASRRTRVPRGLRRTPAPESPPSPSPTERSLRMHAAGRRDHRRSLSSSA